MAGFEHGTIEIADTYARTLAELTQESGASSDVLEQFGDFIRLMEVEPSFGEFLRNPAVDADARRELLEKHFRGKMADVLLNTLQVINRKNRAALIPLIYERYRLALEEARNEVEVYVTSAIALTDELRAQIRRAASEATGRNARLIEKVKPDILGGLIVRIGDDKIDTSVAGRLERMRDTLRQRASREIRSGKEFFEAVEK